MKKETQKLMIIDGNALIHRSFHALPDTMILSNGQVINAVFGFTSVLIKALREFKPEYIVVTLDKKGPTFRHKKYKEYKANRTKAPDELYAQIPMVKEIVKSFNIPIFEKSGFEADDLIGTIAKQTKKEIEKIIVTGDMDTLQLVNKHTLVYAMSRGVSESVLYNEEQVKEKYQLTAKQIVDYKALRGDPGDNIPGVRGVGEKTATKLLLDFKTLEGVYKNIKSSKIKDRIRKLLMENKDNAFLSQDLATIDCEVEIDFDLKQAVFKELNKEKIAKTFGRFEFRSLLARANLLFDDNGTDKKSSEENENKFARNEKQFSYHLIKNDKDFNSFFKKIKTTKHFSFDTETTGVDTLNDRLLGISFSWQKGEAYYLNFDSASKGEGANVSMDNNLFNYKQKPEIKKKNLKIINQDWLDKLATIFADEGIKKNAHNAKFDIKVLENQGLVVNGLGFDTMIAAYLLNPGERRLSLDALSFSEFGFEKINKVDLLGKGRDRIEFAEVETEKMSLYSCEDADFSNRLYTVIKEKIKKEKLEKLFKEIELPLVSVLSKMETSGIKLDTKFLSDMNTGVQKSISKLEKEIFKLSGKIFNIKSTQQLSIVLFNDLNISSEGIKKNKTGYSTAFDELEKIKEKHKIVVLIQEFRELTKLQNTYIEALPKLVDKKTKRIHTNFNQTVAATGRLSSSDPNLQNIPTRTDLGRQIRKAFIAPKGHNLISFDYSQIELRLAAQMSGDKKMIAAFDRGVDIHSTTASLINNVKLDEVTKKMRSEAKAVNFGILYGQGPHGLSQGADISYAQAKEFIDNYFQVYSGVKDYLNKTIEDARKNKYVSTMFGRKRKLPEINSTIPMVRKSAERMASNTPLQGTAADIIKMAMIEIHNNIFDEDIKMLIQVHDELVFEISDKKTELAIKKIKNIMENVVKLKVEMKVDVKIGKNWGEMTSIKN